MKIAMVSRHVPDPAGTAAGRALHALGEGLVDAGHDLDVWSWWHEPPAVELPPWCRWQPLPDEPAWRTRGRALVRPRADVVRAGWAPARDADVVVADDPGSFPAVAGSDRAIATVHYGVGLDAAALGDRSPRVVQDIRAERALARNAAGIVAYSDRVARAVSSRAVMAPIACPVPDRTVPLVDAPVAACIADWSWPPNQRAADRLLRAWPDVRARVAGAVLVLAGSGSERYDAPAGGVRGLGRVADTTEVLAEAAVLAFPCPPTSGPKVKVLEAMGVGLPVVTTAGGVEGVVGADGVADPPVVVAGEEPPVFAAAVAELLTDAPRRARLATEARTAFLAGHAPGPAAEWRVQAWTEALSAGPRPGTRRAGARARPRGRPRR